MSSPQTTSTQLAFDKKLRAQFINQIAEFLQKNPEEVESLLDQELQEMGILVANAWSKANPRTPEEITLFYQETDSYIFNLAADHCLIRRRDVWNIVVQRITRRGTGQRVLVYGDGIGTDSLALARLGHEVTYFDVPGRSSEFARFRFGMEKLPIAIKMVHEQSRIPSESFDVVVCIEVLEHLPDPPGLMRALHGYLRKGGIAVITESFDCVGPDFPSHLPENFQYAGRTHRMMEVLGFANTFNNSHPINYPMEFTKIDDDASGRLLQWNGRLRRAGFTRWNRLRELRRRLT